MSPSAIAMAVIGSTGLGVFAWDAWVRLRLLRVGQPDVRWDHVPRRLRRVAEVVLGQSKLLQRPLRGVMHVVFFWGFPGEI
jgi:hypothetical protein